MELSSNNTGAGIWFYIVFSCKGDMLLWWSRETKTDHLKDYSEGRDPPTCTLKHPRSPCILCTSHLTKPEREMKVMETRLEHNLYCRPSSATTPTVNLPSQLKHCSHDLWPRNWSAGERLSVCGFWFLKLNVQMVQEPHLDQGAHSV